MLVRAGAEELALQNIIRHPQLLLEVVGPFVARCFLPLAATQRRRSYAEEETSSSH